MSALSRFPIAAMFICLGLLAFNTSAGAAGAESAAELVRQSGVQGGLAVYAGAPNAEQTALLRANNRWIVQGLMRDAGQVAQARQQLVERGRLGAVTVLSWDGRTLPYAGGIVNLLIAERAPGLAADELMRVLAYGGVAYLKSDGRWTRQVKPWPDDVDEWTHFLHEPDNNAVADDTRVQPPHHLRWTVGPRWGRTHDHLASMSAAVSAAGRLFYIIDEGPVASVKEPSEWKLVARDAFSGVLLWKKDVGPWEDRLRPFRSGPAELPRRLVAVGDRVYVTLGYGAPVTALDAATGEVVHTYAGTENTHEILCRDGELFLVVSEPLAEDSGTTGEILRKLAPWRGAYRRYVTRYMPKHLRCLEADSGKLVWKKQDADTFHTLALTMAVTGDRVFFENEKEIVALGAASGEVVWKAARPIARHRYAWASPTLVVEDGVVLSADRSPQEDLDVEGGDKDQLEFLVTSNHLLTSGQIMAFSAKDGKELWQAPCHDGFNFPTDVFVIDGKVYSGELAWSRQPGITKVYNLHTGEVVAERPPDQQCYTIGFGHARCYRNKATTQYILHGRSGVEFLDLDSTKVIADHWIRGTCQYGILPCNGLLYVPPHSCACYITAKLNSFNCLAPKAKTMEPGGNSAEEQRLEKGPAYGKFASRNSEVETEDGDTPPPTIPHSNDWPTYRRDNARSGVAGVALPAELKPGWEQSYAGPLTSLVVANGKVLLAQKDLHTVHALSAADGSSLWQFTAGGRIDSPPSVCGDRVYFGSADGWIYCLRAGDGALAWRFRAAPQPRHVVAYEQLESVWPVHGSVLVRPGSDESPTPVVYAVAGRSSFLDGGLFLVRLDARTGQLLGQQRISHRDPQTGQEPQATVRGVTMPGALPDVLSTDGTSVFMRHSRFDLKGNPMPADVAHLYSPAGFLDGDWWHRTYWQVGTAMGTGYGGWTSVGNRRISGRLLVTAGDRVFGFGRKGYSATGSHVGLQSDHHVFAAATRLVQPKSSAPQPARGRRPRAPATQVQNLWSQPLPFFARAMLLAGDTLLVAGPTKVADLTAAKPAGDVWLWAISPADGEKKAEYKLRAAPVLDSMAATKEGLFFTTVDGRVVCYRAKP